MSMCPHTRRSDPMGLETAFSCHDSPLRVRCRTQIHLWGFQFDGGGAIIVLEWPGGGVGRTVSGKCRLNVLGGKLLPLFYTTSGDPYIWRLTLRP